MNDGKNKKMDEKYMTMALDLASKGRGMTNPNPMVGAIIVKDGKIIGKGFHKRYGELHAERMAIKDSTDSLSGTTMYVTLEPCCHTGKNPPCTDAIIESGISRVVVGTGDPNPKVAGQGLQILRANGIRIDEGIMEKECRDMNRVFFHYINTGLPYVTMKYAMTMDGKIATASGASKWITGNDAREHVHIQRSYNKAVMVGKGTVLKDDPVLTCRTSKGANRNPVRIICDTGLNIPLSAKVIRTAVDIKTIIITCCKDEKQLALYEKNGCQILCVGVNDGRTDLVQALKLLGEKGIDSILLEGGSILNWEMLRYGLVNRVQTYIAPKLFGGDTSKTPLGGEGIMMPENCCALGSPEIKTIGNDILIESEVYKCLQV